MRLFAGSWLAGRTNGEAPDRPEGAPFARETAHVPDDQQRAPAFAGGTVALGAVALGAARLDLLPSDFIGEGPESGPESTGPDSVAEQAAAHLAERAKRGDRAALQLVYDQHGPAVLRFLRDMLRDSEAAADALQETFARVFQKIGSLEDPRRLVPWIFGIARHVSREHKRAVVRHAGGKARRSGADEGAGSAVSWWKGLGAGGHEVPERADAITPEDLYSGAESAQALERAITSLSPDRRAILLLRCDHFLSYEEIAVSMGCSVAKVKIELHRARAALREALLSPVS